jgi:phosphoribosylformylglycinamidine cyclo-ligase
VSAAVTAQGLDHWTIGTVTVADGAERVKIG